MVESQINNGLLLLFLCNFVEKNSFSVLDGDEILALFVGAFVEVSVVHVLRDSNINVMKLQVGNILD